MDSGANSPQVDPIREALDTVRRLANPGGCAWHEVQTHETLLPYLVEESAEFVDAIDRALPAAEVSGELGDVLYQVLFHAVIAERDGEGYSFDQIASDLTAKLIARHPHVFGDRGYMSVEELNAEWERLKEDAAGEARGSRAPLEGIPAAMPTLARAAKVVERLKRAKLVDPAAEVGAGADAGASAEPPVLRAPADAADAADAAETAIGDAMIALVLRANAAGVDADRALRLATNRLVARTQVNDS